MKCKNCKNPKLKKVFRIGKQPISSVFFEKPKNRKILMIGKDGKIEADLNAGIVKLFKKNKKKNFKFKFNRNNIFKKQIEYFINCVKNKKKLIKNLIY